MACQELIDKINGPSVTLKDRQLIGVDPASVDNANSERSPTSLRVGYDFVHDTVFLGVSSAHPKIALHVILHFL